MPNRGGFIRPYAPHLSLLVRLADAAIIALSLLAACLLRGHPWMIRHGLAAALAVALFYIAGEASGLYGTWRVAPMKLELGRVWMSWGVVVPGLLFAGFLSETVADYSRMTVLLFFVLAPVALSLFHVAGRLGLQEVRRRGGNSRTVAIVGACEVGERVAREVIKNPWMGLEILGFYDDRDPEPLRETQVFGWHDTTPVSGRVRDIPEELGGLRGDLSQLVQEARSGQIDIVYIALPLRAETRIRGLIQRLADTTASVHVVPDLFLSDLMQSRFSNLGQLPVLSVFDSPFHGIDGWTKRIEDLVLGSAILSIIALPMALVALGIKLTSKGPVFFKQKRYGLNGEEFTVLKFRSMTVCEDGPVVTQAKKNDVRVTPFGAFIRRTSLDELPQFLQVLTGHMSIVGPRPHAVAHNELYRGEIQGYMLRHKVKPGITGWAQVHGWRGETDTLEKMEKRVAHDLAYIENWGVLLDFKNHLPDDVRLGRAPERALSTAPLVTSPEGPARTR